MKLIYNKLSCPQCGELHHINVNGICFDCRNEKNLETLAIKCKDQIKLNSLLNL